MGTGGVIGRSDDPHWREPVGFARYYSRCFLLVGLPALLALVFIIPPLQVPDEPSHFLRAVAIAEGHFFPDVGKRARPTSLDHRAAGAALERGAADFAESGLTPAKAIKSSRRALDAQYAIKARDDYRFAAHSNTAIYPPILYVFPSVAVVVARIFFPTPLVWLYMGRLADAVVGGGLMAYAIRRAHSAAPFVLLLACSPVSLFLGAGLSADALLLPATALLATMTLRLVQGRDVPAHDLALLCMAILFVGAGKVAYLPLAAMPALAVVLSRRNVITRSRPLIIAAVCAIGLWAAWATVVQDKVFSVRDYTPVDPKLQLQLLLQRPGRLIALYQDLWDKEGSRIIRETVGYKLGWSEFGMPAWFCDTYLGCILLVALIRGCREPRSWTLAVIAVIVSAICCLAISVLLYAQFNEVGSPRLLGVQGRYLLPLVLMVLCLIPGLHVRRLGEQKWVVAAVAVFSTGFTIVTVTTRYWV